MSNEEEIRSPIVEILSSKRRYSFDSQDSLCGIRGNPSTTSWAEWLTNRDHTGWDAILDDIERKIVRGSKEDREGWSPECNGSTAAFFENYQGGPFYWRSHWPNTRLPRSHRTRTTLLVGCTIIEVDLVDEVVNEQVPPCINTLSVQVEQDVRGKISESYSYCNQDQEDSPSNRKRTYPVQDVSEAVSEGASESYSYCNRDQDVSTSNRKHFQGFHEERSYDHICRMINSEEAEGISLYTRAAEIAERENLQDAYSYYVNQKGRTKKHVSLRGIDKTSDNYKPNTSRKDSYGANYCIKTIGNTFVYHQIGRVSFTVAEYFGQEVVNENEDSYDIIPYVHDKNNTYNIVQVVHGSHFTRKLHVRVIQRYKYNKNSTIRKLISENYNTSYFDKHRCYSKKVNVKGLFDLPERLINVAIHLDHQNYSERLRNIYNVYPFPHDRTPVPLPDPDLPSFEQDKKRYRLYRLYLGTQLPVHKYKEYKYLDSRAYDKDCTYKDTDCRPINIQSHHLHTKEFRNWIFNQFKLWAQIEDLRNHDKDLHSIITTDPPAYPPFKTDFYKVKYMITRE